MMEKSQMMRGNYKEDRNPVVMDIHYKSKYVDLKTKIRAKMFITKDYYCDNKKCWNYGVKTSLKRTGFLVKTGLRVCRGCNNELKNEDKKIIKLYITDNSTKTFIDFEKFLYSRTDFSFRKSNFGQIASYEVSLEDINKKLEESKKRIEKVDKKNKIIKIKCIITPLTWEVLEKKWERVKELKLIEAI